MKFKKYTVEELVQKNMLEKPIDGNHGNKHPKSSDYTEQGIPFIMVSDISNGRINYNTCKFISKKQRDTLDKGFSKEGDVLLSHKATIGITCIVDNEYPEIVITPQLTYYRVKKDINNYYLKYYFDSHYFQHILKNWATSGSTRAYLGITAQLKLPILLPDIIIQNKIVTMLQTIDKKIELNNQINDNLQAIITNIFNDIIENNDEFQTLQLSDVAKEIVTGKTPSTSKSEYWNGEIPFVTIPDMHNEVYSYKVERCLSDAGSNSQIKKLLPSNSIMVSCIATVGLVSINPVPCHTNQQINSIITKNDYDLFYLYEMLKTKKEDLKNIGSSGSATLNVNKNQFEKINIDYPKKEILIDFDKKVRPLFKRIMLIQQENIKLEQIRDTLLPKLMNGEINLDKIEI